MPWSLNLSHSGHNGESEVCGPKQLQQVGGCAQSVSRFPSEIQWWQWELYCEEEPEGLVQNLHNEDLILHEDDSCEPIL